jgi:hypothetical protein
MPRSYSAKYMTWPQIRWGSQPSVLHALAFIYTRRITMHLIDTGNYYIRRKSDGQWFSGFAECGTAQFGDHNHAKPYATELEARVQADFLPTDTQIAGEHYAADRRAE